MPVHSLVCIPKWTASSLEDGGREGVDIFTYLFKKNLGSTIFMPSTVQIQQETKTTVLPFSREGVKQKMNR